MPTAHINIGSNLGDSRSLIGQAVAGISLLSEGGISLRRSRIIESSPWGFSSSNRFLNIGVEIESTLHPEELLQTLLSIQNDISAASHRNADGTYADRLIDIDLIYHGDATIETPVLTLPHPRMHLRDFVLIPMTELCPGWVHPLLRLTPAQMLASL